MVELRTPQEVDQFLQENKVAAIFKAGTCHKTMQGWGNVERLLRDRDGVPVGIIRVVEWRPASNRVAELSGVTHESPQVILFQEGQPKFDLDNWDITVENLGAMLDTHLPEGDAGSSGQATRSNLEPYKQLLDAYLAGALPERDFQYAYLNTFKGDASLRSQEEFDVLNSLFGNPDEHHIHPGAILSLEPYQPVPLRDRAQQVRQQLNAF
ncbi:MAG TPA: thioredoxin family protein [Deinococcales bacterium]|nr:thioredoxin family protein [Deinococcales bacterium]